MQRLGLTLGLGLLLLGGACDAQVQHQVQHADRAVSDQAPRMREAPPARVDTLHCGPQSFAPRPDPRNGAPRRFLKRPHQQSLDAPMVVAPPPTCAFVLRLQPEVADPGMVVPPMSSDSLTRRPRFPWRR